MRIRFNTEDWREQIIGWTDIDESDVDYMADDLCSRVVRRLEDDGHTVKRAGYQSVGAFALFQGGTDAEREAFDDALNAELAATVAQ